MRIQERQLFLFMLRFALGCVSYDELRRHLRNRSAPAETAALCARMTDKSRRKRVRALNIIPEFQISKGCVIVTAALELSTNQVAHFYSSGKNTDEMIKLLELLQDQYRDCTRLYFSWDAAGWHASPPTENDGLKWASGN